MLKNKTCIFNKALNNMMKQKIKLEIKLMKIKEKKIKCYFNLKKKK